MITEESFVDFVCPACGQSVSFPREEAGLIQACPSCTESLVVPADGSDLGRALPLPISTPRLVLRRFRPADWKDLLEFLSDEELFQYEEGYPMGEEQILQWLDADGPVKLTTPGEVFNLGIELQSQKKVVGYLTLRFIDSQRRQATLTITMSRACHRQGLGSEALAGLLGFCLGGIALHRVTAMCDTRNAPACGLFEKAGLRREGVFQKNRFINGEWVDTAHYALLNEEYRPPAT